MQRPSVSWKLHHGLDGEQEVLVLTFGHGVELHVAGEHGLRLAHWETREPFDPDVQRGEVARALAWARAHDGEIQTMFKNHASATSGPAQKPRSQPSSSK